MTNQTEKIIRLINISIKYCYYSLFFVTPLLMTSITSELFEFNKIIFIYLITIIISFLWITKIIIFKKIIIKKTPIDIPIFLFFISQVLSTIFSIDQHTSIFGYYGRFNGGLLSITAYIILYYAFVTNLESLGEKIIINLLKTSIFSSIFVILWGLPAKFGYDFSCWLFTGQLINSCWSSQFRPAERLFSTLGQPNWLGAYLAINFFIALYFFIKPSNNEKLIVNNKYRVFFYSLYLILNFITILFTRSRSALLSVIIGLTLLVWYFLNNFNHFYFLRLYAKKFGILVCCLFATILIFKTGINRVDRLISLDTYSGVFKINPQPKTTKKIDQQKDKNQPSSPELLVTDSADIRKIVWKGAIELGKRYPLFGTGVETFAYSYYFVRPKEHNLTSEWDYLYNKAHNEYLNYLATTGFLGFISYLVLIGVVLKYFILNFKDQKEKIQIKYKKEKTNQLLTINNYQLLAACLLLAYLSILITNFFGFSTTTINLFFYLIPAFILSNYKKLNNETIKQSINDNLSPSQKIFLTINILFSFYLLISTIVYWVADINYANGDKNYKLGNYQQAFNYLNQALNLRREHVFQDKISFILANLATISDYQKQKEMAQSLIQLSKLYNQQSLRRSPKNVLYWKTRAKNQFLYYQINENSNDLKEGIDALIKAKQLAPTDPKINYSLAMFYSLFSDEIMELNLKQKYQNLSLKEINLAINLKPNDKSFYLLKGQLLKKYGKKLKAKETFQYILDNFDKNDAEVLNELNNL